MTVSELIDLLREQEREGHGDSPVVGVVGAEYDAATDGLFIVTDFEDITITELQDLEPDDEEEEDFIDEYETTNYSDGAYY